MMARWLEGITKKRPRVGDGRSQVLYVLTMVVRRKGASLAVFYPEDCSVFLRAFHPSSQNARQGMTSTFGCSMATTQLDLVCGCHRNSLSC